MATFAESSTAFVWIWLPGATDPVVAGRLDQAGPLVDFTYGRSYLARPDRIPLYLPELPLRPGRQPPLQGEVAGCIADAGPDRWGRRVIENRRIGEGRLQSPDLGLLTYLLESGSDRVGALDFQSQPDVYVPRAGGVTTLSELVTAAERVEAGIPLSTELADALLRGSSIGGARPKSVLASDDRRLIAKFSSTTDSYPIVKGEFVAMALGRRAGLEVAPVEITGVMGRDVLLVERFDRQGDGTRRALVSALTILGLDDLGGRYASYAELADTVRARFTNSTATLRELFARITFNILVGNNDDHARNHAAFWDGTALTLTPAYDICPQPRAGGETQQAMAIGKDGYRYSQLAGCIERAATYLLDVAEARSIVDHQVDVIRSGWSDVCDLGQLTEVERGQFWGRQFLNPYALEGY